MREKIERITIFIKKQDGKETESREKDYRALSKYRYPIEFCNHDDKILTVLFDFRYKNNPRKLPFCHR